MSGADFSGGIVLAVIETMTAIFTGQRTWYFGLFYVALFLLQIVFTLVALFVFYYGFTSDRADTTFARILFTIFGLSCLSGMVLSWWAFGALSRRTAAQK